MLRAFVVHLVALGVGRCAGGTPQQFTLVIVSPARALIAKRFSHAARFTVHLEHVDGAVLALAGAVFRQVALVLGAPALGARRFRPASFQIATLAGGAARVAMQHAGGHVAARIVAVFLQAAVALLARFHESVTANRAVEQLLRFVSQTIIHAVLERQSQMLQGASGPVRRSQRTARRCHDTSVIRCNRACLDPDSLCSSENDGNDAILRECRSMALFHRPQAKDRGIFDSDHDFED